ncbi:MAG: phosphoenolpyruvate--protein phosphotransferase [Spirochaetaceae bacterium]|jgi:phosphotransferase system enzyme I (PtsI)|nr:phosphoenolpyruvate--protein phosphotransferase [Spirochaetaceae bacterium]
MKLEGIPASPGIAIGPAYVYRAFEEIPGETTIAPDREAAESARLEQAFQRADDELKELIAAFDKTEQGRIFSAHRQMLWDEEVVAVARRSVHLEHKTPEWSVYSAFEESIQLLINADDPVISARGADLADIRRRLLRILTGRTKESIGNLSCPIVLIASELTPSDTATLDRSRVLGIVTERGGLTSHTAIIANAYGLPAVLSVNGCTAVVRDGQNVCVDALDGVVFVEPEDALLREMEDKRIQYNRGQAEEERCLAMQVKLTDGEPVEIGLNISNSDRINGYKYVDFVGLFRTEFLYMDNDHIPAEDEQYYAYKRVLEHAGGKPVTLRTLDIGGDKNLPYLNMPTEDNPFLGQRALRLCLAEPLLFRTQLRAALRASVHGKLNVMFPMVSRIEDFRAAKTVYNETRAELEAEGKAVGDVNVGIMIEVPSIAIIPDIVAAEVDFASIGTNDLCQYLCAADRMNGAVAQYYQVFSPAMARLIGHIITAFGNAGKPISVCGEMAGDPRGALLLAGLGLRKFSVGESRIAAIKALLTNVDIRAAENTARLAKNAATQDDVLKLLHFAV